MTSARQNYISATPADIMFEVASAPVMFVPQVGGFNHGVPSHKVLFRTDNEVPLNVVGASYKVIQNSELFAAVDNVLATHLGTFANNAIINDAMSYEGKRCVRQYIFNSMSFNLKVPGNMKFRIVVDNSFGGSALRVHTGAIDFYCMNGLISGDFVSSYFRHTSGVTIQSIQNRIDEATKQFLLLHKWCEHLVEQKIKFDNDNVQELLLPRFTSPRVVKQLATLIEHEILDRGPNMFSVLSALTNWSSHLDIMPLRQTANDHAVVTMLRREQRVHEISRLDFPKIAERLAA